MRSDRLTEVIKSVLGPMKINIIELLGLSKLAARLSSFSLLN